LAIVRRCVWQAKEEEDWHEAIECAVRTDGTAPAEEFLTTLAAGEWSADPHHRPPGDAEQIHDYARLLAKMEHVGRHGMPDTSTSVEYLHSGVWEFKHGARRLTYWDTPGDGSFSPKPKLEAADQRTSVCPDDGYWWYPDMDTCLRLGPAWPKTGQKAPPEGIEEATMTREEDCAHDAS
jgi:hypothetical protein